MLDSYGRDSYACMAREGLSLDRSGSGLGCDGRRKCYAQTKGRCGSSSNPALFQRQNPSILDSDVAQFSNQSLVSILRHPDPIVIYDVAQQINPDTFRPETSDDVAHKELSS